MVVVPLGFSLSLDKTKKNQSNHNSYLNSINITCVYTGL